MDTRATAAFGSAEATDSLFGRLEHWGSLEPHPALAAFAWAANPRACKNQGGTPQQKTVQLSSHPYNPRYLRNILTLLQEVAKKEKTASFPPLKLTAAARSIGVLDTADAIAGGVAGGGLLSEGLKGQKRHQITHGLQLDHQSKNSRTSAGEKSFFFGNLSNVNCQTEVMPVGNKNVCRTSQLSKFGIANRISFLTVQIKIK